MPIMPEVKPLFASRMGHGIRRLLLLLLLFAPPPAFPIDTNQLLHHQLQVEIEPRLGRLIATDRISLPKAYREVEFILHANLTPRLLESDAHLASMQSLDGPVPLRRYRIQTSIPRKHFTVTYHGTIQHELTTEGETGTTRHSTPGLISEDGIFLAGSSYWYPQFGNFSVSFELRPSLPEGWRTISQGDPLPSHAGWQEHHPQEEIYLIAFPYHYYQQQIGTHLAEVYFRQPNPTLAERYLQATGEYIALYEKLLGPYPYGKFALVENFWESGYGMPSFTLLGPRVIQLPFIIHTSYPHEILHNWWGNGVYVDASSGNWSEGLTTYLADHLLREQQGTGAGYRRTTLQNYTNYVAGQDDFPLRQFRANHGHISQSVGYGKTLMLFHMLRMELGDPLFLQGLQRFYRTYQFQPATFEDIQDTFESVSGKKLGAFFSQWLTRTGAPVLELISAEVSPTQQGYRLRVHLKQTQREAPFQLKVPLFVHYSGVAHPLPHNLEMSTRDATLDIVTESRPLKVSVDPLFDLFRRLDPSETPSSLGQLFGSKRLYAVLPDAADDNLVQAYRLLANQWQQRQPGLILLHDSEIDRLPEDGPVWILGSNNRFARQFKQQLDTLGLNDESGTFALTRARAPVTEQPLGFITTTQSAALAGLARKLPHYGRYSYALFTGDEPVVRQRGEWRTADSALSVRFEPGDSANLTEIPEHKPLAGARP